MTTTLAATLLAVCALALIGMVRPPAGFDRWTRGRYERRDRRLRFIFAASLVAGVALLAWTVAL